MLKEIPSGTKIFIDSNILIYHFLDIFESCTSFLKRVEIGDIEACTSTVVLAEVLHRLTIAEVVEKYNIKPKNALRLLKEKTEIIPMLEKGEKAIQKIPEFSIKVLSSPIEAIWQSRNLRREYSLLTNDSLNLYIMRTNHLSHIATNDTDFERVKGVKVWKPSIPDKIKL